MSLVKYPEMGGSLKCYSLLARRSKHGEGEVTRSCESCRCKKRPPDRRHDLGRGTWSLPNPDPTEENGEVKYPDLSVCHSFISLADVSHWPNPTGISKAREPVDTYPSRPAFQGRRQSGELGWKDLLFLPCSSFK